MCFIILFFSSSFPPFSLPFFQVLLQILPRFSIWTNLGEGNGQNIYIPEQKDFCRQEPPSTKYFYSPSIVHLLILLTRLAQEQQSRTLVKCNNIITCNQWRSTPMSHTFACSKCILEMHLDNKKVQIELIHNRIFYKKCIFFKFRKLPKNYVTSFPLLDNIARHETLRIDIIFTTSILCTLKHWFIQLVFRLISL